MEGLIGQSGTETGTLTKQ